MSDKKNHVSSEESDQEERDATSVPATVTNRFFVHANQYGFRIAFGEKSVQFPTKMHSAVHMNIDDTKALADMIYSILDQMSQSKDESGGDGDT